MGDHKPVSRVYSNVVVSTSPQTITHSRSTGPCTSRQRNAGHLGSNTGSSSTPAVKLTLTSYSRNWAAQRALDKEYLAAVQRRRACSPSHALKILLQRNGCSSRNRILTCADHALQSAKAHAGLRSVHCGDHGADAATQDWAADTCTGNAALSADEAWLRLPSHDLDLPPGKQRL